MVVLKRIFGYLFVNVFVRLQTNFRIFIVQIISTNNHSQRSRDLCTWHRTCMMASNVSSSLKRFHSIIRVEVFSVQMQCSVPFVQQSLCLQCWDNGLQRWVCKGCTVRFVYRIFEYSFVWGYSICWDLEYSF